MKSVYLFDLDGTLTDSREGITKSVRYALNRMGLDSELKELEKFIGPPLKFSFCEFFGMTDEESEKAIKLYRDRYKDTGIFENKLYENVIPVLKELKSRGKKVCMATCKPEVFARRISDHFGITPYFDEICGTTLDGTKTTKAQVIEEVLERIGEKPENAVMIGDREHDVEGAKHFSMPCVGVTFGFAEEGELEKAGADYIIDSLTELLKLDI